MPEPYRRTPLHHHHEIAESGAARIAERPSLGKLVLRCRADGAAEKVTEATGMPLPLQACTAAGDGRAAILWIGPDEWWIVTESDGKHDLAARLGESLSGTHHQLVDVTDYYTTIEVAGLRARDMLMKLTTLDLHPRMFGAGSVAGSLFGRAQAVLWHVHEGADEGPHFRLFVRWSMADYLWCLLAEAGREYGLPPQEPAADEVWRLER